MHDLFHTVVKGNRICKTGKRINRLLMHTGDLMFLVFVIR